MRLLADESVTGPLIARLREDGHVVSSIGEDSFGIPDELVLERANLEGIVLLTQDKDFGELIYRRKLSHHGIVLLRIESVSRAERCDIVSAGIRQFESQLPDAFTVMTPHDVRIRLQNKS